MNSNPDDPTYSIYWLIMQLSHQVRPNLAHIAEQSGLTGLQAHLLCALTPGTPWPMFKISQLLSCDNSNVTGLIDRLLMHGYIDRRESPDDRRIKMIALTKEGVEARKEILARMIALEQEGRLAFTISERQALQQLLLKILQSI